MSECGCKTTDTAVLAATREPNRAARVAARAGHRARRALQAAAMHDFDEPFPVPAYPPREWFEGPPEWVAPWRAAAGLKPADDGGILRLTITDQGQIGGWFFNAGQCLVHDPNACPKASPTRYAAFHQSDVLCSDGTMLDVGVIGMTHGHQSPWLDWKEAQRLYADPTAQKIICVAGDDPRGGWIAGCLVPGTTYGDVALMRRSGLSGDWRPMPKSWWTDHGITASAVREAEGYDCIGPTLVTRPALPLTRNFSIDGRAAAILGGAAGIELDVSRFSRIDRERIAVIAAADPLLAAPQGNPEALRQWYNDGADGQINWGEHGAFDACVAIASGHMDEEQAKGFCAERHNDATGKYPGASHGSVSRFARRAYLAFDESAHPRGEHGRFTFTGPERTDAGGVIPPRDRLRVDLRSQAQRDKDARERLDKSIGKFDFGVGDTGPPERVTPVTLPNRVSLYPDNVQALIDANPQMSGEDDFAYQGRIVQQLDPQSQSDVIYALRETYEPVPFLADAVDQWNSEHGLAQAPRDIVDMPVDIAEADEVARFFETAPDQSGDPAVQAAYDDFTRQNEEMYGWLTRPEAEGGLGVTVDFTTETDPYPTAAAQADDLRDNHHITIQSGLGGDHTGTMSTDEYDRFRAVHDVFGHAAIGGGFDRHGEYEAWLLHASMYDDPGRLAMSTEYHGVNSALWSGEPGTPGTGKSVLLPVEFAIPPWERGLAETGTRTSALEPDKAAVVQKFIDALDLKPGFAEKFDHPEWHDGQPMQAASRFAHITLPSRFTRRAYAYDESKHPRGEGGRFTFGEGGADQPSTDGSGGASLAERFIKGEKGLVLPKDDVATFTDRIAEFGRQEKERGEGSRLNLCEVSVPGTNLFCGENQGISRQDMPQLKGEVRPDSPAAAQADSTGNADITSGFVDKLRAEGVNLSDDQVKSQSLKSTQKELVGEKVAGIAQGIRDGKIDIAGGDRILVSKDNYILDGHHRWAGAVLNDAEDGHLGDSTMPIIRVDMGILDLVKEANDYATQQGIVQKTSTQQANINAAYDGLLTVEHALQAAAGGTPGDRLRAIAQRMAMGQHKLHEKPGPIMSALMSAGAHIDRGNTEKGHSRLDEALQLARDLEDRHPKELDGLTDEIQGIADEVFPKKESRMAATKTEDGKNFGPSDYAYVPDSTKPSTWKLRLTATPGGTPDAGIVGAAAAALGAGFRGNKVEIPSADRAKVVAKVRGAWKKANPGKSEDDMPDVLKSSARSASSETTVSGMDTRTIIVFEDGTRLDSASAAGVVHVASAAVVASVVAAGDLPVAPPDTPWDENTAKKNLLDASGGDLDTYGKAFLFHDDTQTDAGPDAYYWPIADVVDGQVQVVPAAIDAAMAAINDGTIGTLTPEEKDATVAILTAYAPAPAAPEPEPMLATTDDLEGIREEMRSIRARTDAHDEFMDDYLSAQIASILDGEQPYPIPTEPPLPVVSP